MSRHCVFRRASVAAVATIVLFQLLTAPVSAAPSAVARQSSASRSAQKSLNSAAAAASTFLTAATVKVRAFVAKVTGRPELAAPVAKYYSAGSFSEYFSGGVDNRRWLFADGYANGQPFEVGWSHNNHHVSGGSLKLDLKKDQYQDPGSQTGHGRTYPYTSGEIRTRDYYGAGCYSVCMKPSSVSGTSSSFYAHAGKHDRPSGWNHVNVHNEIDVEFVGGRRDGFQTNFFSRYKDPNANSGSGNEKWHHLGFDTSANYNVYGFKWTAQGIDWYVNGRHIRSVKAYEAEIPSPAYAPMRVVANLWAVDGARTNNWAGPLDTSVYHTTASYKWMRFDDSNNCGVPSHC